ncbi:hypothetical protein [Pseudoalteromonas sp. T1lg23B]|uniref:hypothetical protein n=1 Tax=Pseudoalteromonas sp. T1lg23B TaxID=2077097 RepID=UPI000CF73E68|nr:hypothetical protein [Pseudoalteromonas sp. T1lg23B]
MIKKKSKARGVKIIIENPEIQPRIAINTFRYSIQETVIRNGDSSCKPFKRHKGITSGAIMNKFGFTYYFDDRKRRDTAVLELLDCIPRSLINKVKVFKTYRRVSKSQLRKLTNTVRLHWAA